MPRSFSSYSLVALALATSLVSIGCGSPRERSGGTPPPGNCRCEGAVPEGTLSVACGATQCVGGIAGYACTGPNAAVTAPEACEIGDGGVIDPDAATGIDGGGRTTETTFTTFLDDTRLGLVHEIHATSPRDAWLVTDNGQVLHWTGGETTDAWSFGSAIRAVHALDATHVWVAGDYGTIATFDGVDSFNPASSPTSGPLFDTWGDSTRRFVAGQLWGELRVATGPDFDAYTPFEVEDGAGGRLSGDTHCVSGTSAGLWVCGEDALYGYDGSWHHIYGGSGFGTSAQPLRVIPVTDRLALSLDEEAVTLVTFREVALESGFGPVSLPIPPGVGDVGGPRLRGVWGNASEVWVVGTGGFVAHMTGYTDPFAIWRVIDVGTTRDLESITADAEALWIGGDSIVLRAER